MVKLKIKINSDRRKIHKIFLRTKQESVAYMNAILKAQGYGSPLEQYTITEEIERTSRSAVLAAKHNALGVKVVIKAVPSENITQTQQVSPSPR